MTTSREHAVPVTVRMPPALHALVKAAAERHNIPLNTLILIWLEAQLSPGADVVLGKAHS